MELQGEDGSVVELSESVEKELGRGPGFAPHDRTVSRRQVRLQAQRIAASKNHFRCSVSVEVIGPNPICVIHSSGEEVEIAKSGTQSSLEIGDKFSLSIQEPIFYTLQEPRARVGLGAHRSGELEPPRSGNPSSGNSLGRDEDERHQTTEESKAAADSGEEEGIAEAVARWQRRKQERLQVEKERSTQEGDRFGGPVGGERKRGGASISQQELVVSNHNPPEADDPELTDGSRRDEDDTDFARRFGFVVEGSEFERYGKRGLDTSKWDWQVGKRPPNDSDEDDDEESGGQVSHDQAGKRSRITAGSKVNQKSKRANDDDEDDWRGDNEGEKELLSTGKRPVPQKKDVQTRSHDLATSSEPRKKRKLVATAEHGADISSRQATASTSTEKSTKRKSRAKDEEEEEDDDGEDLVGFLVDDVEEEDELEDADDEDELTDEDEDEAEDENEGELEEEDETDAGRGKRNVQLPGHAPAPSRPVEDNELDGGDGGDDKPLCKYGSKCFRKNKDHMAQFRH